MTPLALKEASHLPLGFSLWPLAPVTLSRWPSRRFA
jgi:hypothetical protein